MTPFDPTYPSNLHTHTILPIFCPSVLNQTCMKHKAHLFTYDGLTIPADKWSVYFSACIFLLSPSGISYWTPHKSINIKGSRDATLRSSSCQWHPERFKAKGQKLGTVTSFIYIGAVDSQNGSSSLNNCTEVLSMIVQAINNSSNKAEANLEG